MAKEPIRLSPLFTWRSAIASPAGPSSSTDRWVAVALSLHMSERGTSAYPSVATLARETGLSERQVQTSLKRLRLAGWLVQVEAGGATKGQRRRANEWAASFPESLLSAGVQDVHPSSSAGVQDVTGRGAGRSPQDVIESEDTRARARGTGALARLDLERVERWLAGAGLEYAEVRQSFHEELARLAPGLTDAAIEELRLDTLRKLQARQAREEPAA